MAPFKNEALDRYMQRITHVKLVEKHITKMVRTMY